MRSGPRSQQVEKALAQKWRPNTAKNKIKKINKNKNKGIPLKKKKKELVCKKSKINWVSWFFVQCFFHSTDILKNSEYLL